MNKIRKPKYKVGDKIRPLSYSYKVKIKKVSELADGIKYYFDAPIVESIGTKEYSLYEEDFNL